MMGPDVITCTFSGRISRISSRESGGKNEEKKDFKAVLPMFAEQEVPQKGQRKHE
jgi:hypothetical protein